MPIIDITEHVINYLNLNFVGKQVSENGKEIDRTVNSLGIGDRTNAHGDAKISSFSSHNGKIEKAPMFDGYGYRAELNIEYRYDGYTGAEKYTIPGGVLIDHPWGTKDRDFHCSGEIEFHIHAGEDNNWTVEITRMTFEINENRPNQFVRDYVAVKFLGVMKEILREAVASSPNPS